MIRIKEITKNLPKPILQHKALKAVASKIFSLALDQPFVQSISEPEGRYGISLVRKYAHHHNTLVPDFQKFGPNEKYLINTILFADSTTLLIVGGIGVGKTRFMRYYVEQVLPTILHKHTQKKQYCPFVIYFDFLELITTARISEDTKTIISDFLQAFCNRVEAEIASNSFFDLEHEVIDVWEELIKKYSRDYRKNDAISFIISKVRDQDAEKSKLEKEYDVVLQKRKDILTELKGNPDRHLTYLSTLIHYISEKYFDDHKNCILAIIDNLDRESSIVQDQIKNIIKPFARTSNIRTIMTIRQTTYYQRFDDGFSSPIEKVAYCGPSPLDIVIGRLTLFSNSSSEYTDVYPPDEFNFLVEGAKRIRDYYLTNERICNLFRSLCGNNVRKGLMYAVNLIDNSTFDPYQLGFQTVSLPQSISPTDVYRAIIVGTDPVYTWTVEGLLDNPFQVNGHKPGSHFIKLRILRALIVHENEGMSVNRLLDILLEFKYPSELVLDAINQMKDEYKRLLWSDTVRDNFDNCDELVWYGNTILYISSAGKGYINYLFKSLEFVQEMMLDTYVKHTEFPPNLSYKTIEERFQLVFQFLKYLQECENEELKRSTFTVDEYEDAFNGCILFSRQMLEGIKDSITKIYDYRIQYADQNQKRSITVLKDEFIDNFDSEINICMNIERAVFLK
jgi:hypothetical protein